MAAILSLSLLLASSVLAGDFVPTPVRRQASASSGPLPLTDYTYTYPNVPEQVNPYPVGRGPQFGYNVCNKTTEGESSLCQTMFVNTLADFCLWGSPDPNGLIGNVEAKVVAYCSQPGHGTRIMPPGTIISAEFVKTPAYIQVTGQFNQSGIGLDPTDYGGELDPHGADLAGNPLGGLVFSSSLPTKNGTITQANNWNTFVGSGLFCIKVCDNTITDPDFCQNRFDLIGCDYNMPSDAYKSPPGTFIDCQGDNQLPVGVYVSNGVTSTWSQPASLSPGSTLPYQPVVPPSSSCTTYTSSQLYAAAATAFPSSSASAHGSSATARASGSGSSTGSAAKPSASSAASGTRVHAGVVLAALAAVGGILV